MSVFAFWAPRSIGLSPPSPGGVDASPQRLPPAGVEPWRLDRNCSMSPRTLAVVLGALGLVSLLIAALFVANGAWVVLPFALAEVAALALAFFFYARGATDGDRLWFDDGNLVVERECAGRIWQRVLPAAWVDVRYTAMQGQCLTVQCGRDALELGQWAPAAQRERVWKDVRLALAERRRVAAG